MPTQTWISSRLKSAETASLLTSATAVKGDKVNINEIRERFESDELSWADLLEITGLPAATLYEILEGLI